MKSDQLVIGTYFQYAVTVDYTKSYNRLIDVCIPISSPVLPIILYSQLQPCLCTMQ